MKNHQPLDPLANEHSYAKWMNMPQSVDDLPLHNGGFPWLASGKHLQVAIEAMAIFK